MFSWLVALVLFNRSRYSERLQTLVDMRTAELKIERQKLASVIDHANEGVLLMDATGVITRANPAACSMFGYRPEEMKGLAVHDLVPEELREQHHQLMADELEDQRYSILGNTRELTGQRKNGSQFAIELNVNMFDIGGRRKISAILRDITERKQREWTQGRLLAMRILSQQDKPLHERLQWILEGMADSPWDFLAGHAAVFLAKDQKLVLAASLGWTVDAQRQCTEIPLGECLCGTAMSSEQPVVCPHRPKNHHELAEAEKPDIGYLCLPITHRNKRLGLISITMKPGMIASRPFLNFYRQVENIIADMILHQQTMDALRDSEQKHRQLVEAAPVGIVVHERGILRYINPTAVACFGGGSAKDFEGTPVLDYVAEEDRALVRERMAELARGNNLAKAEEHLRRLDGSVFLAEVWAISTTFEGRPAMQTWFQDITDRKRNEEKIVWLSYYDELTGLPNQRLLFDRAHQALALAQRGMNRLALIYIGLDRFKLVNDSLGHSSGDLVLRETGRRLASVLRETDTAARIGGDEFVVLLQDVDVNTARRVADKVYFSLHQPVRIGTHDYRPEASFGIAIFPQDGKDVESLLKHADTAMYHARKAHTHIHYFSDEMETQAARYLLLEQELAKAVDRQQLMLYYQGKHAINGDGLTGVESLLRWHHPELGMVPPSEFIPLAEETGLIHAITRWVLREACQQAMRWEQAGVRPGRIGVNISGVQLMQAELADDILACIRETGCQPAWIEIEITETAVMREPKIAIAIMQQLVDADISIAIDDFGTGYSSMIYLKRLPAKWLKIDMAFIRHLPDDAEDVAIVRSTIAMAHALNMKTIAEGVETEAQLGFLLGEGCDAVQGYLFSKPLPADEAIMNAR